MKNIITALCNSAVNDKLKEINELAQYQFDNFKEMLEYIKNELGD